MRQKTYIQQFRINSNLLRATSQVRLQKLFRQYGSEIAPNFTSDSSSSFLTFVIADYTRSLFLFTVKPEEVLNTFKSLKNISYNVFTHIPVQVLKSISKLICTSLSRTINIYISKGIFPQSFIKATVIPIHKSGATSLVPKFRSTSIHQQSI